MKNHLEDVYSQLRRLLDEFRLRYFKLFRPLRERYDAAFYKSCDPPDETAFFTDCDALFASFFEALLTEHGVRHFFVIFSDPHVFYLRLIFEKEGF